MPSIPEELEKYREAASGTGDADPSRANRWHARLHASYRFLRDTEEGRKAIASLLHEDDPHVRGWAAAHCLQWVPAKARAVLEGLRDADGPCAFDAAVTLQEFEAGRLSFDY